MNGVEPDLRLQPGGMAQRHPLPQEDCSFAPKRARPSASASSPDFRKDPVDAGQRGVLPAGPLDPRLMHGRGHHPHLMALPRRLGRPVPADRLLGPEIGPQAYAEMSSFMCGAGSERQPSPVLRVGRQAGDLAGRVDRGTACCRSGSDAPAGAARLIRRNSHSKPGALHPGRRARLRSGVKVERGADADQRGRFDLAEMFDTIHFSCLGIPSPTQTKSGLALLIAAISAASSSGVRGRNGGDR